LKSRTYCINLDRRPDRWEKAQKEFELIGITDVHRFSAIDAYDVKIKRSINKGETGCLLSHLDLIKAGKWFNLDYLIIFEDDVEFHPGFNKLFDLSLIPGDWDMIYFGGNDIHPATRINDRVSKLNCTYTTHAYMIRNTIFDKVIELIGPAEKQIDVYYADLHPTINAYGFRPKIAFQRECYSDIQNRSIKYKSLL